MKYWIYAPGFRASKWDEFYEQKIMALGWEELGDLREYNSKEEIALRLRELHVDSGSKKNDATANWDFVHEMQVGDLVFVKKGRKELIGYGIVRSEYRFDSVKSEYRSVRDVDWKQKGQWPVDHNLVMKTLTDITRYASGHPDFEKYSDLLMNVIEGKYHSVQEKFVAATNIILYGPPGTGKTYSTKAYAVSLAETGKTEKAKDWLDSQQRSYIDSWKQLRREERIEFLTFHQSFSYEDFVQGIRPDVADSTELKFKREDGVFKRICTNALFEYYKAGFSESSQNESDTRFRLNKVAKEIGRSFSEIKDYLDGIGIAIDIQPNFKLKRNVYIKLLRHFAPDQFKHASLNKVNFEELWNDFVEMIQSTPESQELMSKTGSKLIAESVSSQGNLRLKHGDSSRRYTVSMARMKKLYDTYDDVDQIKNINDDIRKVIGGSNSTMYWTVLKAILRYEVDNDRDAANVEDLDSLEYEDKLKRIQDLDGLSKLTDLEVPQFVLVIDEINRANISRVLGELITLLEPDKRLGQHDELIITLPSGEEFCVPPNLHVIGTMNTADKSIAHLDVALRRRFKFQPMYPDSSLAGDFSKLLADLNTRIEDQLSPELTIGHSFFMNDDSIDDIMNDKVIPLMMEYFNHRTEDVVVILKGVGVKLGETSFGIPTCIGYEPS